MDQEVLIVQKHSDEDDLAFIQGVLKYIVDKRYIRIKNKPLLVIYRPNLFTNIKKTVNVWRNYCREIGIGEIYLALVQNIHQLDPRDYGFDGAIEFHPNCIIPEEIPVKDINKNFKGKVFDAKQTIKKSIQAKKTEYDWFRGVMTNWDNTPRRKNKGHIYLRNDPKTFKQWLEYVFNFTVKNNTKEKRYVFVNAWNEWAEGTCLEPDRKYGFAYLNATARALDNIKSKQPKIKSQGKILFISHDACHAGAQIVLYNIVKWFKKYTAFDIKIVCIEGGPLLDKFKAIGDTIVFNDLKEKYKTERKIYKKIIEFCKSKPELIYGNSVASGRIYRILNKIGVPIITHVHELQNSIEVYASDCIHDVNKYTSHYIACSKAVAENLKVNHGVSDEKIDNIYAFIDGGLFEDNHPNSLPPIEHETTSQTGILHQDGTLSMARYHPGTATTEFFICLGVQPELDYGGKRNPDGQGFAAFGKVVSGMDVVKKIHKLKVDGQYLDPRIVILDIVLLE